MTLALNGTELGSPGYAITVLKVAVVVTVTKFCTKLHPPGLVQEIGPEEPAH